MDILDIVKIRLRKYYVFSHKEHLCNDEENIQKVALDIVVDIIDKEITAYYENGK